MTGPMGRRVLKFDSHFVAEDCGIAFGHALTGVRVDGPKRPKVLRVLRFDSHFVAEGCGGAASRR